MHSKEEKVYANCDMFAKALTLLGITLSETANIHF